MRTVNTKFFLILVSTLVVATGAIFTIHRLQAGGIANALLWQANQAEGNGKLDQAARFLGRYLEFVPEDLEQRSHLAEILSAPNLVAAGPKQRRRARFVIEQVLAKDPLRHSLRQTLCRLLMEERKFDAAGEHLTKLEQGLPDSAEVACLTGEWHQLQNHPQDAATAYRRALEADPKGLLAYVRLVGLLKQMDFGREPRHAEEIGRLVAAALEKGPTDASVLSLASQLAQEKGDTPAALRYLENGLKHSPQNPVLYQALARVHTVRDDRAEAIAVLRRGLQAVAKQHQFELTWTLANLLLDGNRLDESRSVMGSIREINPLSAQYLDARCQMLQGRWFEAAKALENLRPQLLVVRELVLQLDLYLGACYEQLEEHPLQLAAFQRAVETDPTSLLARRGMAAAHWALGQPTEALAEYEQAVRSNVNRAEAARWRIDYARMLLQSNTTRSPKVWVAVERQLDEAERQLPRSVEAALVRAEVLFLQGKREQAQAVLEKSTQDRPERFEPWISLAAIAMGAKQTDAGTKLLEQAEAKFASKVEFRLALVHFWMEHAAAGGEAALARIEKALPSFVGQEHSRLARALAEGYLSHGQTTHARRLLTQLAQMPEHKEDLRVRMQLFELARDADDDAEMQRVLAEIRAIEGAPATYWSYGEATRLIRQARRGTPQTLEKARQLLTAAAAQRPNWHAVLLARAEIDEMQGKLEQAIANYRAALDLGARDPHVMKQYIVLLSQAQRLDEAEQEIRKMQKQFGASADLVRMAVAISYSRKDYARAEQLLRQSFTPGSTGFRDYLWMGQVLAARGQASEEAEKAFRQAVQHGEKQPETWLALVRYLIASGQAEKARAEIDSARLKLDDSTRSLTLAQCHELMGDTGKAIEFYRLALKEQPQSVPTCRMVADFLLRTGRPREAESLLRRLMDPALAASETEVAWARRKLALALVRNGDPQSLAPALQLVGLALNDKGEIPDDKISDQTEEQLAQARVLAAVAHHRLRNKAVSILESLHQKNALQVEDQFLLARLYHASSSDAESWRTTRELLKTVTLNAPRVPRYLAYYANLLVHHKEVPEAEHLIGRLEQLEKERMLAPGMLGSVELRALCLELRGKGDEAVAVLKRFAEEDGAPPSRTIMLASLHGRLGHFKEALDLCARLREQGRFDEAFGSAVAILRTGRPGPTQQARLAAWIEQSTRLEADLRQAVQKDADYLPTQLQLADLLDLEGKLDDVEKVCREILRRDDKNLVALNNLAWLLAQRKNGTDEALALISRAIDAYGARPELLDTRAVVYLSQGKNEQSINDLLKVVDEAPTPARYFHLSRAHHQANNRAQALAALERADALGLSVQQLHPSEQEVYQRLASDLKRN